MDAINEPSDHTSSSLLSIFHEDVILRILEYVADVPFEIGTSQDARSTRTYNRQKGPTDHRSTLTHTLPLVSKQFHRLCSNHDLFWKCALLRLIDRGGAWEEGMQRFVFDAKCCEIRNKIADGKRIRNAEIGAYAATDDASGAQGMINKDGSEPQCSSSRNDMSREETMLDNACKAIEKNLPENHTATPSGIYQCLYQSVLQNHMRYQAPVFYMPTSIRLGVEYGLHFFEPRYRILISEVIASYPVSARRGERIKPMISGVYPTTGPIRDETVKVQLLNFLEENEALIQKYHVPTFIHAHQSPIGPNIPATIVQVLNCAIEADGRADVLLLPIAYIWIEELWERSGTGGLLEARGLRMEKETGDNYEMWCAMSAFGNGDGRGRGQMLPIP